MEKTSEWGLSTHLCFDIWQRQIFGAISFRQYVLPLFWNTLFCSHCMHIKSSSVIEQAITLKCDFSHLKFSLLNGRHLL